MTAEAAAADVVAFGCRLRSELQLPELAAWNGDDRAPDITIRLGAVPERFDDPLHEGPFLQIDRTGGALVRVADVAAYWIRGPQEVIVSPRPGATDVEVRVFLLNTVLGLLCHRRGQFALSAACVVIDGRAVALCGASGTGKSTLAAALQQRGHAVLADELCAVSAGADDGPTVLPVCTRLKLWADALDALGIAHAGLARIRPRLNKFHLPAAAGRAAAGAPLGAIVVLSASDRPASEAPARLGRPAEKLAALGDAVCAPQAASILRPPAALLAEQAKLAGATPIWRFRRGADLAGLAECARHVEAVAGR